MTEDVPSTASEHDTEATGTTAPAAEPGPEGTAAPDAAPDASGQTEFDAPSVSTEAREAWDDVIARMGELGEAVARWTRAAVNDPGAKQKLSQIKGSINDIASKGESAFSHAAESDAGRQFAQGAEQAGAAIGDAATQFATAAAPHVKTAFEGLAAAFGKAAGKVDEAARSREASAATPAPPASATGSPTADQPEPASAPADETADESTTPEA